MNTVGSMITGAGFTTGGPVASLVPVNLPAPPAISPSPPTQASSPPHSPEGTKPAIAIDWNLTPPIHRDSMTRMLEALARQLDCTVFLAVTGFWGQVVEAYCSDPAWNLGARLPPNVRSGLLEASVCETMVSVGLSAEGLSKVLPLLAKEVGASSGLAIGRVLEATNRRCGIVALPRTQLSEHHAQALAAALLSVADSAATWTEAYLTHRSGAKLTSWRCWLASWRGNKGKLLAMALAATLLIMLIPVPYWPKRKCVLEPTTRQYVASPVAGRIKECLVRPGDQVTKGQLLARLHEEDLQMDLAKAQAELAAADKKRSSALANAAGNMRIVQLEMQQVQLRIEMIKDHLSRLEVRSPIDGTIVQGDWSRSEGSPVERGGTLFEIAPLDRITVETHLLPDDLSEIEIGDRGTLRVDWSFGNSWQGTLQRIEPTAKVVDDLAVFVAEMEVSNDQRLLRPGARGSVRISTGTKTIGWLLFYRPLQWFMKKVVW